MSGPQDVPPLQSAPTPPPPGSPSVLPGFNWNDFFEFKYMITPTLIRVIYIVGVALITLFSLLALLGGNVGAIVGAILLFVFGNLFFRVYMELVMLFFGMHDALRSIEHQGR